MAYYDPLGSDPLDFDYTTPDGRAAAMLWIERLADQLLVVDEHAERYGYAEAWGVECLDARSLIVRRTNAIYRAEVAFSRITGQPPPMAPTWRTTRPERTA